MYQPALYSSNNQCAVKTAKYIFRKYRHLLNFKKAECILDIGTGDGRTTAEVVLPNLPKDFKEFIISDKSKIMIDYARQMEGLSKMPWIQLDIGTKCIPQNFKNRFHHITLMFILHYVNDTRQALRNMYDMLKQDGEIFSPFLEEIPEDEAFYGLSKHPKWSKYHSHISPYYKNTNILTIYQKYLKECGFQNWYLEPFDYEYDFTEQEFRDFAIAVNLDVKNVPEEYLNEYLEEYFKLLKNSELCTFKKAENGKEIVNVKHKLVMLFAKKPVT